MAVREGLFRRASRLPVELRLTQGFCPVADELAENGRFDNVAAQLTSPATVALWRRRLHDADQEDDNE